MRNSSFLEGLIWSPLALLLCWVAACSVLGFALCAFDKTAALRNTWRVPEKIFFIVAGIGGTLGVIYGTKLFRHKTRKGSFKGTLGLMLIAQFIFAVWLMRVTG